MSAAGQWFLVPILGGQRKFEPIAPLYPVFRVIPDDPRRSFRLPVRVGEHSHDVSREDGTR